MRQSLYHLIGRLIFVVTLLLLISIDARPRISAEPIPPRPNFILIVTDDQEYESIAHMPILQAEMVAKGMTFAQAYNTSPLCCPSRTTLLRGQYIHNHGVLANNGRQGGFQSAFRSGIEASTVATWLQAAGYRTGLVGKYLNQYPLESNPDYVPPGWTKWYATWHKWSESSGYYDYYMNRNGENILFPRRAGNYHTDVVSRFSQRFIRQAARRQQPFFLYVAPFAPHGPSIPAGRHGIRLFRDVEAPRRPSFNETDISDKPSIVRNLPLVTEAQIEKIDRRYRKRLRTLQAVDEMIGQLLQTLADTGQLEHTYILFTTDNGYHNGEHRIDKRKGTPYQEVVHVPLIIRGPGIPAGNTDAFTINNDYAPTFAALAGVSTPDFVDGRSLAPLWADTPPDTWRVSFLISNKCPAFPEGIVRSECFNALRTARYLYIARPALEEYELYDMLADPYQLDNLYTAASSAVIDPLTERLADMLKCSGATCRQLEDQPIDVPALNTRVVDNAGPAD